MKKFFVLLVIAVHIIGCHRVSEDLQPTIGQSVQDSYLKSLPSPFSPLSLEERAQDWGKEYTIGLGFAHQLDLYQAITAFKRAEILIPPSDTTRIMEIRYEILLCYYLGQKYEEVAFEFEHGSLRNAAPDFPAFHDLLVILYDVYLKMHEETKAEALLQSIAYYYPDTAKRLATSTALIEADFPELKEMAKATPSSQLQEFLATYKVYRKSPGTAQTLNTVLPGAGYLYVGQYQTALTAALLNGLFIAASYHFYDHHHIAAGTIFLSFEFGWYFGGIFGAGLEAKSYNERLYEELATPMMNQERLFPVLNLKYAF